MARTRPRRRRRRHRRHHHHHHHHHHRQRPRIVNSSAVSNLALSGTEPVLLVRFFIKIL